MNKPNLSSLTNMLWISSAFITLAECGGLNFLCKETNLTDLQYETQLPPDLLSTILDLLSEEGFIKKTNDNFCFSSEMIEVIKKEQPSRILSLLRTNYGQAFGLINAARDKTLDLKWSHKDDYLLQAQGEHSERIVTQVFEQFAQIKKILSYKDAKFLDVGAGVGSISIKVCEIYPHLSVVSLEPAEKPFQLAQQNIKHKHLEDRIELRKHTLENLNETDQYDLVWFPQAFIADEVLDTCAR